MVNYISFYIKLQKQVSTTVSMTLKYKHCKPSNFPLELGLCPPNLNFQFPQMQLNSLLSVEVVCLAYCTFNAPYQVAMCCVGGGGGGRGGGKWFLGSPAYYKMLPSPMLFIPFSCMITHALHPGQHILYAKWVIFINLLTEHLSPKFTQTKFRQDILGKGGKKVNKPCQVQQSISNYPDKRLQSVIKVVKGLQQLSRNETSTG